MNPYTLYPLTNQRAVSSRAGIPADLGIAFYKVVKAIEALWNWIDRTYRRGRATRELSRLSDHMLKDIGIRREDIRALVATMLDGAAVRPVALRTAVKAAPAAPLDLPAAANDNRVAIAASISS